MICSKCQFENIEKANFCIKCGKYLEKNHQKKDYNKDIFFVLFFFILQLLYLVTIHLVKISNELFSLFLSESIFAIIILCFAGYDYNNFKSTITFKKLKLKPLLFIILFYPVFGLLVYHFSSFLNLHLLKFTDNDSTIILYNQSPSIILSIISVSIFPALFEELAFRGYLFNRLFSITRLKTTILISAILFTLLHLSIFSILWIFPLGISFGFLRAKYRTIWYGVFAHLIYNSTIVAIDYFTI